MFFEGEIFAGTEYTPMYLPTIAAMAQYRYPQNRYEGLSDADAKLVRETAEHKAFRATEERFYIRDCPAYLPQPLTVLSSSRTASAAEYLLSALKYKNRAVIVGEASYGSTGQPIFGALPGGGSVAICTAKCVMPDGFDYNNVGIPADVEVKSTREDAMRGYDYIFEKGLEVLRGLI
jgi:C-terminal processing protease CtpA/Prc